MSGSGRNSSRSPRGKKHPIIFYGKTQRDFDRPQIREINRLNSGRLAIHRDKDPDKASGRRSDSADPGQSKPAHGSFLYAGRHQGSPKQSQTRARLSSCVKISLTNYTSVNLGSLRSQDRYRRRRVDSGRHSSVASNLSATSIYNDSRHKPSPVNLYRAYVAVDRRAKQQSIYSSINNSLNSSARQPFSAKTVAPRIKAPVQIKTRVQVPASTRIRHVSIDSDKHTTKQVQTTRNQSKKITFTRVKPPVKTRARRSQPETHKLFTKGYADFIGADSRSKQQASLSSLSTKEVRDMYTQQLLLGVPSIKAKAYFGCVSSWAMSRAMHDDSVVRISEDFLRNELAASRHRQFGSDNRDAEIRRMHRVQSQNRHTLDRRVMCELQKSIAVESLEDFGIDIFFLESFFDKKVSSRNLRPKSKPVESGRPSSRRAEHSDSDKATSSREPEKPNVFGAEAHSSPFKNSILQNTDSLNLFSRRKTERAFWNPHANRNFSVIKTRPEAHSEPFSVGQSFLVKQNDGRSENRSESETRDLPVPNHILYSFSDDVTMEDATHVQKDDYERTRLHSKSFLDLSKIDWSVSALSKNPSVLHLVGPRALALIGRLRPTPTPSRSPSTACPARSDT